MYGKSIWLILIFFESYIFRLKQIKFDLLDIIFLMKARRSKAAPLKSINVSHSKQSLIFEKLILRWLGTLKSSKKQIFILILSTSNEQRSKAMPSKILLTSYNQLTDISFDSRNSTPNFSNFFTFKSSGYFVMRWKGLSR